MVYLEIRANSYYAEEMGAVVKTGILMNIVWSLVVQTSEGLVFILGIYQHSAKCDLQLFRKIWINSNMWKSYIKRLLTEHLRIIFYITWRMNRFTDHTYWKLLWKFWAYYYLCADDVVETNKQVMFVWTEQRKSNKYIIKTGHWYCQDKCKQMFTETKY